MNGKYYELSGKNEPDHLVIVISANERLLCIKKGIDKLSVLDDCTIFSDPFYENDTYAYYWRDEVYQDVNSYVFDQLSSFIEASLIENSATNSRVASCQRSTVNSKKDYINKARFSSQDDIRRVEDWVHGKPEVRLYVVFAQLVNNNPSFSGLNMVMAKDWYHRKWGKVVIDTENFDYNIIKWTQSLGDNMKYVWIEEDGALTRISLDVNVSTTFNSFNTNLATINAVGSSTITIGNYDKVISETYVNYCDNTDGEGTEYVSSMRFWVNQQ